MATLASLAVSLGLNPDSFNAGLASARSSLRAFREDAERMAERVEKMGSKLSALGKLPTMLAAGATSAAGMGQVVGALIGSAAILPGVLLAGAGAMAAWKMGVAGIGEALSATDPAAFEEAMSKLSPAAQEFVRSVKEIGPAWKGVQLDVQEKMMDGLGGSLKMLSSAYLPAVQSGLGGVASQIGGGLFKSAGILSHPYPVEHLGRILGDSGDMAGNLSSAVGDVIRGLLAVGSVGSSFLPGLTSGAGEAAQRFREWAESTEGQTAIFEKISGGLSVLGDLALILKNVTTVVRAFFAGAQVDGVGFLETVRNLTKEAALWSQSAEGQKTIADIWLLLSSILGTFTTLLPIFASALASVAGWFASLPGPVQTLVGSMLSWSFIVGALLVKLAPLAGALMALGPRFIALSGWVTSTAWPFIRLAGTITMAAARFVAQVIWMTVTAVARMVWMGIQAGVQAAITAGAWLITTGAAAARAVASMVVTAATMVAQWVMMAAGAMARAAIMAASWIVAMGPVGWVIAGIVALVALIIANWDTIVAATKAAWQWVADNIITPVQEFAAWVGAKIAEFVNGIATWWNKLVADTVRAFQDFYNAAVQKAGETLAWLAGLPGRILSALAGLGNLLWNLGMDLVRGLWNGIVAMGGWLTSQIMGWIRRVVPGPILDFLGIASPSKWAQKEVGRWIPAGLAEGIISNASVVTKAAEDLADAAKAPLQGLSMADDIARFQSEARSMLSQPDTAWITEAENYANDTASGNLTVFGETDDGLSRPGPAGPEDEPCAGGTSHTWNVYNPQAEPSSTTASRKMRTLSALGV